MPNNTQNVTNAKPQVTGSLFTAPITAAVPTDGTSTLSAAYNQLGYANEDGITNTVETDTEEVHAWGGDLVATLQTTRKESLQLTLIESTNEHAAKEAFGDENVAVDEDTGNITILGNSKEKKEHHLVIDALLNGNKKLRVVIPRAIVTEVGDMVYADSEVVGYEITYTALPDASGNTSYRYIAQLETASDTESA
jgi:hypothetical protein